MSQVHPIIARFDRTIGIISETILDNTVHTTLVLSIGSHTALLYTKASINRPVVDRYTCLRLLHDGISEVRWFFSTYYVSPHALYAFLWRGNAVAEDR